MLTFMHFIMEELFLVRKLAMVKEFRHFDNEMAKTIRALNALRNAMAHSFLPENKRDYRKPRIVAWRGKDIYTIEGIEQFDADMLELHPPTFRISMAIVSPSRNIASIWAAEANREGHRCLGATRQ